MMKDSEYALHDATHSSKFFNQPKIHQQLPNTRTLDPYVTGTSILAIKYRDGVMIAGDTLASYGSLARFRDISRLHAIGGHSLIGGTGDISDFQYIIKMLDELVVDYNLVDDGSKLSTNSIHSYLTRVLYGRRNKMDPLWGQFVIGGYESGQTFLGLADLRGTNYEDDTIATGYGNMIARPLLRKYFNPGMTFDEAKKLLEDCLRVLFYRDARAHNKIQISTVTQAGTWISDPYELSTDWSVAEYLKYPPDIKIGSFVPPPIIDRRQ